MDFEDQCKRRTLEWEGECRLRLDEDREVRGKLEVRPQQTLLTW